MIKISRFTTQMTESIVVCDIHQTEVRRTFIIRLSTEAENLGSCWNVHFFLCSTSKSNLLAVRFCPEPRDVVIGGLFALNGFQDCRPCSVHFVLVCWCSKLTRCNSLIHVLNVAHANCQFLMCHKACFTLIRSFWPYYNKPNKSNTEWTRSDLN